MTRLAFFARCSALLLVASLLACRDTPKTDQETSAAPPASASAAGAAAGRTAAAAPTDDEPIEDYDDEPEDHHVTACAPKDPALKPLQLLRFAFASGVERRDPKDKLNIVRPGDRVYAHFKVRNRSGFDRCLHLEFRVNNKKRSRVTLKVGKSWSWRTWAYNTTRADDRGPLKLVVTDDQGKRFLEQSIAIVPQRKTP